MITRSAGSSTVSPKGAIAPKQPVSPPPPRYSWVPHAHNLTIQGGQLVQVLKLDPGGSFPAVRKGQLVEVTASIVSKGGAGSIYFSDVEVVPAAG